MNHNQSSTSILQSVVISESNNETRANSLGFRVGGGSPEGRKKIWSKMSQIPYPGEKVKKKTLQVTISVFNFDYL